jgi:L-threonylcarbamoyladenylate synthase
MLVYPSSVTWLVATASYPSKHFDMITEILPAQEHRAFIAALFFLLENGAIAFPTDTVYGLGVFAFQKEGVEHLYRVKNRPTSLAIPVLIDSLEKLEKVCSEVDPIARWLGNCFWPGPLTLVVPRHPDLPDALSQTPTIGVRVPDHPVALDLLRQTGPMAVTSANLSGYAETHTAQDVMAQLAGRIDLIIDGGRTPGGVPSTVVDTTTDPVTILREGPITEADIREALG